MPKEFNWQWDRMEEYRLEQAPPMDDSEAPEDDDRIMELLMLVNARTAGRDYGKAVRHG